MIYTNGKIIISKQNNLQELEDAIETLQSFMIDEHGIHAEFKYKMDDTTAFPFYEVPDGVEWKHMDQALRPSIRYAAINGTILVLPGTQKIMDKHIFTAEESAHHGQQLASLYKQLQEANMEKKQAMDQHKSIITGIEGKIEKLCNDIQQGYEEREKQAIVKIDFDENLKYYFKAGSKCTPNDVIKTTELQSNDHQLQINHVLEAKVSEQDPDEPGDDNDDGTDEGSDIADDEKETF